MIDKSYTTQIYKANMEGCGYWEIQRLTYNDKFDRELSERVVKSLRNRGFCMNRNKKIEEAGQICKYSTHDTIPITSAYPVANFA